MKWIAKFVTAAQALLLAQVGAAKPGDAAMPSDVTEAAQWEAAISAGTPDALQQFISQFPDGERLGEAFELIVLSEIEAAKSGSAGPVTGVQVSEARSERPEVLEHDFDLGVNKNDGALDEESGGLTPY